MERKLTAGAAKVCITPPQELMPAHYHGNILFEGVYRDIYVRSLIVDNGEKRIALIVFESGDVSRTEDLKKALKENCGLDPENIMFAAVHSHESPTFSNEHWRLKGNPQKLAWVLKYGDFVIDCAVKCVSQAIASMCPCKFGYGFGKSYINVCRDYQREDGLWVQGRDFEGPSDKTLAVLKFEDMNGRMIAAVVNYGVHGTCCYQGKDENGEKYLIAADLPGMVSQYMEERYASDETVVLWTSGAAGDQNPIFFTTYYSCEHDGSADLEAFDPGFARWKLCEHLAQVHSVDAIKVLKRTQAVQDEFYMSVVNKTIELPGHSITYPDTSDAPMNRANQPFNGIIGDGEPVNLQMKLIRMGDFAIFGLNGELYSEIGMHLKEAAPVKDMIIVTHTAERAGYLPTKKAYDNRALGFYATSVKDGCTEERMIPAALEMFQQSI